MQDESPEYEGVYGLVGSEMCIRDRYEGVYDFESAKRGEIGYIT